MNIKFLRAIDTVCKMSNIDLRISDIIECKEYSDSIILHCRNDVEMYEFTIIVVENILNKHTNKKYYEVNVYGVKDSSYSCDDFSAILDDELNIISN